MSTEREIRKVMAQERRRGSRHPLAVEGKNDLEYLLERGTEEEFKEALSILKLKEGTPQYERALEAFRAYRESSG
jgi:hypothetical protein